MGIRTPSKHTKDTIWITVTVAALMIIISLIGFQLFLTTDNRLARAVQRGSEYLMKENYEKAEQEFQKAVKIAPDNLVVYYQLAEAYEGLNDYKAEALCLTQALKKAESSGVLATEKDQYILLCIKLADCYSVLGEEELRVEVLKHGYKATNSDRIETLLMEYFPDLIEVDTEEGEYYVKDELEINLIGAGTIYYTLDDTEPTLNSNVYEGTLTLPIGDYEIKARVYNEYGLFGGVRSLAYSVKAEVDHDDDEDDNKNNQNEKSKEEYDNANDNDDKDDNDDNDDKDDNDIDNEDEYEYDEENLFKASFDKNGYIIWADKNVEAVVRKVLHKEVEAISKDEEGISREMAASYEGVLDLSNTEITTLVDLVWLEKLSVLSCKGKDIVDADYINSLELDRIVAVYHNFNEVKAIDNTDELEEIRHLGICVSNFALGDMTIIEMLEFYNRMNQTLAKFTNLEYVDLSNNGLIDINLLCDINNMNNIKILILRDNQIRDISKLRNYKNLIYLDVTNNNIKDYSPVKHVPTVVGK